MITDLVKGAISGSEKPPGSGRVGFAERGSTRQSGAVDTGRAALNYGSPLLHSELRLTEPLPNAPEARAGAPPLGDAEATFTAMVETHYARLGAFAYRLVGARAAAEDVVHEVLLRIWRRRGDFAFHDPLSYLYQAVRNEAESWRRREARLQRQTAPDDVGKDQVDSAADASKGVELRDLRRAVDETVAALPPRRREIFRMHREQRLSYAEIAALLGISVKTVEVQIGHALKALRRRITPFLAVALALLK
jgi:RNA polymerase sigma-19 factor, ECF subfamily